jgi:hypothetical protein
MVVAIENDPKLIDVVFYHPQLVEAARQSPRGIGSSWRDFIDGRRFVLRKQLSQPRILFRVIAAELLL